MRMALLVFILVTAVSQAAPKDKQKDAAQQQPISSDVVTVVVDQNETAKSKERDDKSQEKKDTEWQLVTETAKLANYTYRLVVVTGLIAGIAFLQLIMFFLQWRSLNNAFVASNRPRIVLRAIRPEYCDHPTLGQTHGIERINYMIANVGATRAELRFSSINAKMIDKGKYDLPVYKGEEILFSGNKGRKTIDPGGTFIGKLDYETPEARPLVADNAQGKELVLFGYLVYFDDAKIRRQSFFYRILNYETGFFERSKSEDLEYEY